MYYDEKLAECVLKEIEIMEPLLEKAKLKYKVISTAIMISPCTVEECKNSLLEKGCEISISEIEKLLNQCVENELLEKDGRKYISPVVFGIDEMLLGIETKRQKSLNKKQLSGSQRIY